MRIPEITVLQLKERLERGDPLYLLDVREPEEVAISSLPEATFIPMGQVPAKVAEIPTDKDVVVICRSGGRSAQVADFLRQQGIERVINLSGGMKSWSAQIDPDMPVA